MKSTLTKQEKQMLVRLYGLTEDEMMEADKKSRRANISLCAAARIIVRNRDS